MIITGVKIYEVNIPLVTPFKTALRTVESVNDIVIKLLTDTGEVGIGEAPPTAVITGDTKGSIVCAIRDFIVPSIAGMDIEELDTINSRIKNCMQKNTSAKAAVDMAVYDLYAKHLKKPLYKVLGGAKKEVTTDITISVNEIPEMVEDSKRALKDGFKILKVKVGKEGIKDIDRILAIRKAVGEDVALRIDANQGWTPREAVRIITALEDKGVEMDLVEQPVKGHDLEGMAYVCSHVGTKILADESLFSPEDAVTLIRMHAADLLNIKLMKTGGISEALKICSIAEVYGVECMIGCMLESKISVSAAAHLAAGKQIITRADLDGPALCRIDPYVGGPIFNGALITMPEEAGIGITNIEEAFDKELQKEET